MNKLGKLTLKMAVAASVLISTQIRAAEGDGFVGVINRGIALFEASSKGMVVFGYLAGIVFGVLGLITLKSLSKPNQEPGKALGCVLCFVAAAGLIYYAATVKTVGETMYDSSSDVATGVDSDSMGL